MFALDLKFTSLREIKRDTIEVKLEEESDTHVRVVDFWRRTFKNIRSNYITFTKKIICITLSGILMFIYYN